MKKTFKGLLTTALLVGGLAAATTPVYESEIHFALSKSAPVADASAENVTEIRLWFTEAPSEGTTSIRLLDADEEPITPWTFSRTRKTSVCSPSLRTVPFRLGATPSHGEAWAPTGTWCVRPSPSR